MPLPINIEKLILNKTIESSRIEYKRSWNPEKVLHTICAFANDYENLGGGYIIIGIEEENSRPREVMGVTDNDVNHMMKDLIRICNMMDPRYMPVCSEEYCNPR